MSTYYIWLDILYNVFTGRSFNLSNILNKLPNVMHIYDCINSEMHKMKSTLIYKTMQAPLNVIHAQFVYNIFHHHSYSLILIWSDWLNQSKYQFTCSVQYIFIHIAWHIYERILPGQLYHIVCMREIKRGGGTNHQWLLLRQRTCKSHCSGQRFVSHLEGASFWWSDRQIYHQRSSPICHWGPTRSVKTESFRSK